MYRALNIRSVRHRMVRCLHNGCTYDAVRIKVTGGLCSHHWMAHLHKITGRGVGFTYSPSRSDGDEIYDDVSSEKPSRSCFAPEDRWIDQNGTLRVPAWVMGSSNWTSSSEPKEMEPIPPKPVIVHDASQSNTTDTAKPLDVEPLKVQTPCLERASFHHKPPKVNFIVLGVQSAPIVAGSFTLLYLSGDRAKPSVESVDQTNTAQGEDTMLIQTPL